MTKNETKKKIISEKQYNRKGNKDIYIWRRHQVGVSPTSCSVSPGFTS